RAPSTRRVAWPGMPGAGSSPDPRAVEGTESPGAAPTPASDLAEAREERRHPEQPNAATLSGLRQTRAWLRGYRLGGEARALERFLARSRSAGIRGGALGVPVSSRGRALCPPEIGQGVRGHTDQL